MFSDGDQEDDTHTEMAGVKRIKHYSSNHKILLIGDGDFSFSACLAKAFHNASNMVATSLNSQEELGKKYAMANSNLQVLKERGCTVIHEVDALTMASHPALKNQLFDRIVFNFPHSDLLFPEHHAYQIEFHRDLVQGFFKSAYKLLAENGQVHVTHKTAFPFDRWNIEELAEERGLCLVDKVRFWKYEYPGYCNKKGEGHGARCDKSFPVGECYTFKFGKKPRPSHGGSRLGCRSGLFVGPSLLSYLSRTRHRHRRRGLRIRW